MVRTHAPLLVITQDSTFTLTLYTIATVQSETFTGWSQYVQ